MRYSLRFGKGEQTITSENVIREILPDSVPSRLIGVEEVRRSLEQPIGSPRLHELVQPGEKVVIITSDITRPMPTKVVLPLILEELQRADVRDEDIKVVFGLGIHRPHTKEEQRQLVGEAIYRRIRCLDSDPQNCVRVGVTSNGTPLDVFREVVEADRRICLGNIEYHYFAGYSGGAKAIMPGVSTREAIQANHRNMVRPEAHAGNLQNNPVREDIDEVGKFVSIDFILNVVLDEHKEIAKAVSGHYLAAHREGCRFLDSLNRVQIPGLADIVITSAGGFPKDLNLYQAQKALDNAKHAVKPGGIIILVAACQEDLGEDVFSRWMLSAEKPEDLVRRIQQGFELGGHKAAAIAMVMRDAEVFLVSEMDPKLVEKLFMKPFAEAQQALDVALDKKGHDADVIIMPLGGSILPYAQRD